MASDEEKRTLEEHLKREILKTGYPLEIQVSSLLERESFIPFNTHYFFDEELRIGRDIDIFSHPPTETEMDLTDETLKVAIRIDLPIECKKSTTHAWVFYTRPKLSMNGIYINGQYHNTMIQPKFSTDSFNWVFLEQYLVLHHKEFEHIAVAYDEIKKEKKDKGSKSSMREIFEATNQLVKFVCYETHQIFKRIEKFPEYRARQRELVVLFLPVIVFDGDIFEVTFGNLEPKLRKVSNLLLQTHYRCPSCLKVESYAIDIVQATYFNEFLRTVKANLNKTKEILLQKNDELLSRIRKDKSSANEEDTE